jgi:hypothetical protein
MGYILRWKKLPIATAATRSEADSFQLAAPAQSGSVPEIKSLRTAHIAQNSPVIIWKYSSKQNQMPGKDWKKWSHTRDSEINPKKIIMINLIN